MWLPKKERRAVVWIALMLGMVLGKYAWDRQRIRALDAARMAGAPRPPAPMAVSGNQKATEEGVHDR